MTVLDPAPDRSIPAALLRLEGVAVLGLSVLFFVDHRTSWWWVALLLAPDLSAIGFLLSNRIGTICYNLAHTYVVPVAILAFAMLMDNDVILSMGLVWAAHIGMDRAIGYGLKYPGAPRLTHLQRV